MYVSRDDLNKAMRSYKQIIGEMPAELQERFPVFDSFIRFLPTPGYHAFIDEPSTSKFKILRNPNAATLLRVWAIKNEE